ncbi:hypothetical protein [Blastococcus aggregatus]|nr:hypothetical protein [Blastococcus aggregatus]
MKIDRPLPPQPPSIYTVADRVSWDEEVASWRGPGTKTLRSLQRLKRPIEAPSQLVHGDMAGNILWHDNLDPAVIDFSPYRRPAGYTQAGVIVDAILWHGADLALLPVAEAVAELDQLVVRALMFRLTVSDLVLQRSGSEQQRRSVEADLDHAQPLVAWLEKQIGRGPAHGLP